MLLDERSPLPVRPSRPKRPLKRACSSVRGCGHRHMGLATPQRHGLSVSRVRKHFCIRQSLR